MLDGNPLGISGQSTEDLLKYGEEACRPEDQAAQVSGSFRLLGLSSACNALAGWFSLQSSRTPQPLQSCLASSKFAGRSSIRPIASWSAHVSFLAAVLS